MSETGLVTLVGPQAAVLVGPRGSEQFLSNLREAVQSRTALTAIVAALANTPTTALPSFACVVREGKTARLIVRGSASAIAQEQGGRRVRLYKPQSATWAEKLVEGASEVMLTWEENLATPVHVVFFLDAASTKNRSTVPLSASQTAEQPAVPVVAVIPPVAHPPPPAASETLGSSWKQPDLLPPVPPPPASTPVPGAVEDFDFSHLVEETRFRGVEAAAVRDAPPVSDVAEGDEFSYDDPFAERSAPSPEPDFANPLSHPTQTFQEDDGGWTPPDLLPPPPPAAESVGLVSAPPPPLAAPGPTAADEELEGATISLASFRQKVSPAGTGPKVHAVVCPSGHLNSPVVASCRVCAAAIADRSVVEANRPSLGLLHFDDGLVVELDRSLVIGRKPARRDEDAEEFGLVTVPDEGKSLSRNHAKLVLTDWQIAVVDTGSTNGTVVEAPGEQPVRLRAGDPHIVSPGVRVVLGGGIGFVIAPPTS